MLQTALPHMKGTATSRTQLMPNFKHRRLADCHEQRSASPTPTKRQRPSNALGHLDQKIEICLEAATSRRDPDRAALLKGFKRAISALFHTPQ
jgi:hypothetical protein